MFNGAGFVESANGVPAVKLLERQKKSLVLFIRGHLQQANYRGGK